jgi:asparagine synthase (glutamine-hydrolysing)
MCGICGKVIYDKDGVADGRILRAMMDAMAHRGPDDEGVYLSGGVGLGHRRLSIIDLSTGKQPISNEDDTVWVVFNGEIYNYLELRSELAKRGHVFKTKTDTEVIVHAYEEYGAECASRLRGMFAIAVWDTEARSLTLMRDRVGIKPLYYYKGKDSLIFASEFKAILKDPSVPKELNSQAIDRFLMFCYTPGPETLLKGICKLGPGHVLTLKDSDLTIRQYWDLVFSDGRDARSFEESKEELLDLLRESAKIHMLSDVPVGILLSGGVDSTALLNLSAGERDRLSTFTIGFGGESFADERAHAGRAARRFGTDHHEMTIGPEDFRDFLPRYVWHMEEAVCEPPAISLYYVSKLARDHGVKVLISGEGGDEAFAGYQDYRNLVWLERLKRALGPLRGSAGKIFASLGGHARFQRFAKYAPLMTAPLETYYLSRAATPFTFFNRECASLYTPEFARGIDRGLSRKPADECFEKTGPRDDLSRMLYVDTKTWLPDDLLVKADKITMANSVELRVPLLDHKVMEFAASLPSRYKLKGFTTKHILKEAFRGQVPEEIIKARKMGFPVPYARWFQHELKGYVNDILRDAKTLSRGYFEPKAITEMLTRHESHPVYSKEIFSLLTLELWHRVFLDKN